jgi:hypothetical protein
MPLMGDSGLCINRGYQEVQNQYLILLSSSTAPPALSAVSIANSCATAVRGKTPFVVGMLSIGLLHAR